MTEPEPYEVKDDGDQADYEAPVAGGSDYARVTLANIKGNIFRAHRFGIYASFEHNDSQQMAVLFPGKSFINGRRLLGDMFKTDQELSLLFPAGKVVMMDLVSQVSRLVPESGSSIGAGKTENSSDKTETEKKCGWVVTMLWFEDVASKPDTDKLIEGHKFKEEDASIDECFEMISDNVMLELEDDDVRAVDGLGLYSWFVVTIMMPRSNTALPHPDTASQKSVTGVIKTLHNPHGGILDCDGVKVFFHRSRVFIDKNHLSITVALEDQLSIDMEVQVDYIKTEESLFDDTSYKYVALLVYTGPRPQLSQLRHIPFPLSEDEQNKYLVAKIIEFDPPVGDNGVESGIAEILKPTDLNTLAFTKNSFKRYVDTETSVKYVKFHRQQMFHLGTLLHKSDLQYFFSSCCFGMSIFYCYAAPLSGAGLSRKVHGGTDVIQVTHEVSLGWKGSVSFLHATGQGGLTLTPNTKEDTLLYPRVFSFQSTKYLGREGMSIGTYEGIVEGKLGSRRELMNGFRSNCKEDVMTARVHDIFPPQGNTGVSSGVVYIESGPYSDQKAVFERKDCWLYGWSLDKTDLQYVMELNESCYVTVIKVESGDEEEKLVVKSLWIGWPPEHGMWEKPKDIPRVDRYKFLLFLECHGLTISDFMSVIKGEKDPRTFLPFRKDEMKGTVIQLDRNTKMRGVRDVGAVSGVIKVDKGPLIGALVTFHRRNTWVLGYNMGKADLTNLFIEGQKVSLEAVTISSDDRKKYPGLPYQYKYRATLVWTSKFRPRNDINKTVPESVHVNNWLKKRGLTWEKFQSLVKGKLPIVPMEIATRHRSNMLRGGELDAVTSNMDMMAAEYPRLDTLPVFRHGNEAARICDEALSVSGPADPRIGKIILSDQNAQMAYHIHKALGFALEEYKNLTGRGTGAGNYSGFGDVFRGGDTGNGGGHQQQQAGYWPQQHQQQQHGHMVLGPPDNNSVFFGQQQQLGDGNVYFQQHQQANMMANRLQQMAVVEERQYHGHQRRQQYPGHTGHTGHTGHHDDMGQDRGGEYCQDRGGMKRQMNSQGGNRGKKNRGGWNR